MKYKIYWAVFIVCLFTLFTIWAGITDSREDCKDEHFLSSDDIVVLDPISNGTFVQFKMDKVQQGCTEYMWNSCNEYCQNRGSADPSHYSVQININKTSASSGSSSGPVTTYDLIYNSDEKEYQSSEIELEVGLYNVVYKVSCPEGPSAEFATTYESKPGLDGIYNMTSYRVTCSETNLSYTFTPDDFTGLNQLKIAGLSYSLAVEVSGSFNEEEIPCISQSYNISHTGSFQYFGGVNRRIRILHEKNGTTASQYFSISGDPESSMTLFTGDDDGNAFYMSFEKE